MLLLVCSAMGCAPRDVRLGRRAMGYGDVESAIRHFEAAAEAEPQQSARWLELARAQLLAELPADARRSFAQLAALRPSDPRPIVEIGFTHELERRYDLALRSYVRARELAPDQAYPHRVLGTRLLRWGQTDDAIAPLSRSVALDAGHAETWKALAMALYKGSRTDDAERTFRSGIEHHVDHVGLRLGLAALLINARRHREALEVYDQVVAMRPNFAAAHAGRGILLHELGRPDEAEAAFERAVEVARDPLRYQARLVAYRRLRARGPQPEVVRDEGVETDVQAEEADDTRYEHDDGLESGEDDDEDEDEDEDDEILIEREPLPNLLGPPRVDEAGQGAAQSTP